jgi:hypothetical protein
MDRVHQLVQERQHLAPKGLGVGPIRTVGQPLRFA